MEFVKKESFEEGRHSEALKIAKNLKKKGIVVEDILKSINLSVEEIDTI